MLPLSGPKGLPFVIVRSGRNMEKRKEERLVEQSRRKGLSPVSPCNPGQHMVLFPVVDARG